MVNIILYIAQFPVFEKAGNCAALFYSASGLIETEEKETTRLVLRCILIGVYVCCSTYCI